MLLLFNGLRELETSFSVSIGSILSGLSEQTYNIYADAQVVTSAHFILGKPVDYALEANILSSVYLGPGQSSGPLLLLLGLASGVFESPTPELLYRVEVPVYRKILTKSDVRTATLYTEKETI